MFLILQAQFRNIMYSWQNLSARNNKGDCSRPLSLYLYPKEIQGLYQRNLCTIQSVQLYCITAINHSWFIVAATIIDEWNAYVCQNPNSLHFAKLEFVLQQYDFVFVLSLNRALAVGIVPVVGHKTIVVRWLRSQDGSPRYYGRPWHKWMSSCCSWLFLHCANIIIKFFSPY